jgi:ribonuclease P/MRP protein subunit POP5
MPPRERRRRRYFLFCVTSQDIYDDKTIYKAVKDKIQWLYGVSGLAKVDPNLVEFNEISQCGIIRCRHNFTRELRAAFAFITEINSKPVSIHVEKVSGTLKSLRGK